MFKKLDNNSNKNIKLKHLQQKSIGKKANKCVTKVQTFPILMSKNEEKDEGTNFCRACLKKKDGMKFLFVNSEETNTLLAKLAYVLNLEELENKHPSYLCKICEKKIESSFEFIEQCKKANDLMYQYWATLDSEAVTCKKEKIELVNQNIDQNYSVSGLTNTLKIHPDNQEVILAIEVLNNKYITNLVCIFCSFQATNRDELSIHVTESHDGDLLLNWCSMCNKICNGLKEHLEDHTKDFFCQFCNIQLLTFESTIEHLGLHKGSFLIQSTINPDQAREINVVISKVILKQKHLYSNVLESNYTCCHCYESFESKEHLEAHLLSHDIKYKERVERVEVSEGQDIVKINIQENILIEDNTLTQNEFSLSGIKEVSKRNNARQRMRLKQYSLEDVDRVVKMVREKLYKHVICIFCQFEATSNRTLSVHVTRVHREVKGRWCSTCNELTDDLVLHNKNVHYEDLKCPFCNKIKTNMGHFMEHMASHSGTRFYSCTVCLKSYISSRHLRKHQQTHANNSVPLSCKICKQMFITQKFLKAHMSTAHKREHVEDAACNQTDEDIDNFGNLAEPQNYCKKCNKKVRSLPHHNSKCHSLNSSINDVKWCLCPHCGKQFKTQSKLTVHIRSHTGETPYKCQYCDKRLRTRNILVEHERIHTGVKPYTCTECGKSFTQSSVLKTHLRIHTGRPEQCTICEKRFCRPAELRLHMRQHTGEKPYACHLCDQRFKQRSHLVEHTKRHSSERPFHCKICDKAFKGLSTLKCHLQIHTGDKPFKCSQCSYACRQPYSLTRHIMQQHDNDRPQADRPYKCEICQRSFTTVAHLNAHHDRFHSLLTIKTIEEPVVNPSEDQKVVVTDIQFLPEYIEFVDQTQSIVLDGSSQMQVDESVENVETVTIQNELNETKFDPMFEFTGVQ